MGVIGPHEGKELELMLTGVKNIALFYSDYDIPDNFLPYLRNNIFKLKKVSLTSKTGEEFFYYIIYKAKYINEVNALASLLIKSFGKFEPKFEREIGRLLGYDSNDIEFYITYCQSGNFFTD